MKQQTVLPETKTGLVNRPPERDPACAVVAQLAEHLPCKQEVTRSSRVSGSTGPEHRSRKREAGNVVGQAIWKTGRIKQCCG